MSLRRSGRLKGKQSDQSDSIAANVPPSGAFQAAQRRKRQKLSKDVARVKKEEPLVKHEDSFTRDFKVEKDEPVLAELNDASKVETSLAGHPLDSKSNVKEEILPVKDKKKSRSDKAVPDLEDLWGGRSWAPTSEMFRAVQNALISMHGPRPRVKSDLSVIDSLVQTILSQNTTDVNSLRCFDLLKNRFPEWSEVLNTDDAVVAETIKSGGLSKIKTQRIKVILRSILEERGELSLEHLRNEPTEKVKEELSRYKGVGPKTIACVLMFNLQRDEFPVDTHVTRLGKRLGWCPESATREETYEFLNNRMPDEIKYELHILLVQHGKVICQAAKPQCKACEVRPHCKTGRRGIKSGS